MSTATNNSTESRYINYHSIGIGYVNRVRMVKPKKGQPSLWCYISALHGEYNEQRGIKPDSTLLDLNICGEKARQIIERLSPYCDAKRSIKVCFKTGDTKPEIFTYQNDTKYNKKGDVGVVTKGRLLQITRAWVDGEEQDLSDILGYSSEDHFDDEQKTA